MRQDYDVAIIGAGLVGATLACALAQAGMRVLVVESGQPVQFNYTDNQYGTRVSAISPASAELLQNLGLWDAVAVRVFPYRQMHVWDSEGSGEIHFDAAELGADRLGYIIENQHLLSVLHAALQAESKIGLCWATSLESLAQNQAGQSVLGLSDGREMVVGLLAGADGADSKVRRLAGIDIVERDYFQQGLVATVATSKSHQQTAWQRFLPDGPLAFLPLGNKMCSIVWSTTSAHARWLKRLPEEVFCAELTQASGYRLGNIHMTGPREVFPLRFLHAQNYIKPGVVLLGDAAHVVHPLAGQGVNLGLLDVEYLVAVLTASRAAGHAVNAVAALRRYERCRRSENQMVMGGLDVVKVLFAAPTKPLAYLRNLGLGWVDRMMPLKHYLMRKAMGHLQRDARPESPE